MTPPNRTVARMEVVADKTVRKAPGAASAATPAPAWSLGMRLRQLRTKLGWTLDRAARETALAKSSLSKIENARMSPSYAVLLKIARGYGLNVSELFTENAALSAPTRVCVTRSKDESRFETRSVEYSVHAKAIAEKRFVPLRCLIRPLGPGQEPEWNAHHGEEFLFVTRGKVRFLVEGSAPVILGEGESIYIDSHVAHAVCSDLPEASEALWIAAS